ncbi:hypothetical protein N658DRAFT_491646 [Parathielavia hyrcaniae]|uniref:Uncharacterized protein n=1 Tax=Parathielavia hyrcaniae TaxID=113614 RepID=A0AAN6Q936_9PEZI|nr:hypothetical protein N658DRAFT_491646 [Parathielavia hyrcaniae]
MDDAHIIFGGLCCSIWVWTQTRCAGQCWRLMAYGGADGLRRHFHVRDDGSGMQFLADKLIRQAMVMTPLRSSHFGNRGCAPRLQKAKEAPRSSLEKGPIRDSGAPFGNSELWYGYSIRTSRLEKN